MKLKILLVEPETPRAWGSNQQYIGLLKIGAYHKARGDTVEYVKGCVTPKNIPDLVLVTSMFTYHYRAVWEAVRHYKRYLKLFNSDTKVVLGGIYATLCPEHAKESGADKIIRGEYKCANDYPPDVTLLDPLPKFAYCMTSRGCSGNCTFCATHLLYGLGEPKQRPVEDVLEEIQLQINRGIKSIYFGDDDLGFNSKNHLKPILEKIIQKKLKVDFYLYGGMQSRHITPELAQLMKKARFKKISLGFESINPTILRRMGRTKLGGKEVLESAISALESAGFKRNDLTVFFMIGLPYQRLEDMIETLSYLISLGVWTHPQRWSPIPNTPDYKKLNLETWDLADLYYKKFVVPNQTEFTHEDLEAIYKTARFFNMGRRYSNWDFLDPKHNDVTSIKMFKQKLASQMNHWKDL